MTAIEKPILKQTGATAKLDTWHPQGIPMDEPERDAYRQLIREAVFFVWNNEHKPCDLARITRIVRQRINAIRASEDMTFKNWPYTTFRSKRTIDRRVNEAASPEYYKNHQPVLVAVTSGIYQPNPALFELPKMKKEAQATLL